MQSPGLLPPRPFPASLNSDLHGPNERLPLKRSSFRDDAAKQTHTPHAVMAAALAHAVRNKVEAAYARSDLFEKRRALMKAWSNGMPS